MISLPARFLAKAGLPVLLVLSLALQAQCLNRNQRDRFIKVFLPNGRSVTAELAVTEAERARGLMFREKIQPDEAMLFVFDSEDLHAFWMKNTLIPLDMLWLDGARRVIHIASDVPPCQEDPCPSYGPDTPASYVLELKAGKAAAEGLKVGDRLQFVLPEGVRKDIR
ncbi:MAG: DUF192 domain-containing protein [Acidobacteriota bacterium]